jgi:hypothetical protein
MMRRWAVFVLVDGMPLFVVAFGSELLAAKKADRLAAETGSIYRIAEQIIPRALACARCA